MVPGLTGKAEIIVGEESLAKHLSKDSLDVLSTSHLIDLLETAAIDAIKDFINPDQLSLGTSIKVKYLSPTLKGMKVTAHALLNRIEKNRLIFLVNAYDEKGKIVEGEHERVLMSKNKFLKILENKKP